MDMHFVFVIALFIIQERPTPPGPNQKLPVEIGLYLVNIYEINDLGIINFILTRLEPDIRQFNLVFSTTENNQKHNFSNSCYYSNKLVTIHT